MSKFMDMLMGAMGIDDADAPLDEVGAPTQGEAKEERKKVRVPRASKSERAKEDRAFDEPASKSRSQTYGSFNKSTSYQSESMAQRSKLVNIGGATQLNMVIVQPTEYSDGRDITNHLKARKPVIVNLEMLDKVMAKKVVDFLSGAVFALDGSMQKVSNGIIVAVPSNMNITGNIGEELKTNLFDEFKL